MVGRGSELGSVALRVRCEGSCYQLPSYRTRSATLPSSEPLPTTTTGHYTICCKKTSVLRSWRWAKVCPKHVELILEINKTVIVASRWFLFYLTYIDDARSNTNQILDICIRRVFCSRSKYTFVMSWSPYWYFCTFLLAMLLLFNWLMIAPK